MRWWAALLLESLFERTRYEVWAAPVPGQALLLEAYGLPRRTALEVAQEYVRRRPRGSVIIVDGAGARVY